MTSLCLLTRHSGLASPLSPQPFVASILGRSDHRQGCMYVAKAAKAQIVTKNARLTRRKNQPFSSGVEKVPKVPIGTLTLTVAHACLLP